MKLTRDETHTIMCALEDYRGLFIDDEDLYDHIKKLHKRFAKKYERMKSKAMKDYFKDMGYQIGQ